MNLQIVKIEIMRCVKRTFHISNFTLFLRKKKYCIEKLFYVKKYTADNIIEILKDSGIKSGCPLIVHSAMSNLYNYKGTADELIDKLIEFVGPNGTLCMPVFPKDKYNTKQVFDVVNTPSAAGYLTEVFRKRNGVKRSLNQLHSVCALGKDAELITSDHHNSKICFDEHSPYYVIGQLGGYTLNIGLPEWFVGTGEHVCEALLYDNLQLFNDKFTKQVEFTYLDEYGEVVKHTMLTKAKCPYIRTKSTKLFDRNFDCTRYKRTRLSNIWINVFDMNYLYNRLCELALEGKTIYVSPKSNQ